MSDHDTNLGPTERRSVYVGQLLQSAGLISILIGAGCFLLLALNLRSLASADPLLGLLPSVFVGLIGVLTIAAGRYGLKRGKAMTALPAGGLLTTDLRAPVLYLRSRDEVVGDPLDFLPALGDGLLGDLTRDLSTETEDSMLAVEFRKIGPPIAVGRPGDELPDRGIAQFNFSAEAWLTGVRDLMMQAQLVVIRAADGPEMLLALETAVKHLDPKKLL